jgi:hypothetical protein
VISSSMARNREGCTAREINEYANYSSLVGFGRVRDQGSKHIHQSGLHAFN